MVNAFNFDIDIAQLAVILIVRVKHTNCNSAPKQLVRVIFICNRYLKDLPEKTRTG
jgi:hypothetical protein